MSAPKPAQDDAEPVASTILLNQPPGRPSDETAATTVWAIAKPAHADPCKATAT